MLREIYLALVVLAIFVTAAVLTWWAEYGSAQLIANAQERWANRPTKLQEVHVSELYEDNLAAQEEGAVARKEPARMDSPTNTSREQKEPASQKNVMASGEQVQREASKTPSVDGKATPSADECRQGSTQSVEAAGASCRSTTASACSASEASCKVTVLPGGNTTVAVSAQSAVAATKSEQTVIVDGQRYITSANGSDDKDVQDAISSGRASPQAPSEDTKEQAQESASGDMEDEGHKQAGADGDAAAAGVADSMPNPSPLQDEKDQQVDGTQLSAPEDGEVNEPELTSSLHASELPQAKRPADDQVAPVNGSDEAVEDAQPGGEEADSTAAESTGNRSEESPSDKSTSAAFAPAGKAKGKKKKGKK
mmetsp:Transcript_5432/g.11816  ORF Transcript_5432/g.11816 Transcript_5432/m.11816 type:complete len:367 (+) Transcript_5432:114-1214(+)